MLKLKIYFAKRNQRALFLNNNNSEQLQNYNKHSEGSDCIMQRTSSMVHRLVYRTVISFISEIRFAFNFK
jgi:hypothetical protein